jgi:hypothetical protein
MNWSGAKLLHMYVKGSTCLQQRVTALPHVLPEEQLLL